MPDTNAAFWLVGDGPLSEVEMEPGGAERVAELEKTNPLMKRVRDMVVRDLQGESWDFTVAGCDSSDSRTTATVLGIDGDRACLQPEDPSQDDLEGCFRFSARDAEALTPGTCVRLVIPNPHDDRGPAMTLLATSASSIAGVASEGSVVKHREGPPPAPWRQ